MVACSVKGCKNRSENAKINKIKFFSFPRNTDIAAKWMKACGKEVNLKSGRICSIHFLPTCYKKKPEYYGDYSPTTVRTLLPDALPTENIEENILYNQRHSVNNILEEINNNPLPIIQNKDLICKILLRNTKDANSFDQPLIDKSTNIISKGGHELEIQCLPTTSNDDNIDDLCTKNINNPSSILPVQDQTAVSDKQIGSENEILQLKKELQKKKKENDLLHKKIKRLQRETKVTINKKIYEILQNVFTPKQIHKIMNPHLKNIKWGIEDIASAVALKSVSPKAYRYLKKNNYPLPGLSTLRNWVSRLDLSEGILTEILALMKRKSDSFSDFQKLIVLCFDEIYISHKAEIDRKAERVVGPHKTCQVSIARGLFTKWKQIIYYGYDQPLTSSIVIEVIKKLYAANYIVIAVTTDLGSGNSKTWKEMNVGINEGQKSFFTHPSNDDLKVFVFADGPHLLKLIRNHYLDRGFFIRDKCISKTCVERMLSINNRDLKVMFKITEADLTVAGQARQKVSTAAKLFSQTTAKAIRWCGEQDFLYDEETWKETAEIFELVNDWFDIFNSKYKNEWDPKKKPYGLNLEYQDSTLNKMTNFMYEMKVKGHKNLLPFQKGVILNNVSLQQLLPYLQEKYTTNCFHVTYVMTNRLTQDCLENLFSYLRAMGAANDQPSALNLKYRLRWYILGKQALDVLSNAVNTEITGNESNLIDFNNSEDPLIATAFDSGKEKYTLPTADEEFIGFANEFQNEDFINTDIDEFENDTGVYR